MKISVVTPTRGREQRLRAMVRCFQAQTHEDRELLILDDGPEPSAWFAGIGDPRVRYLHQPSSTTLGEKRNQLCQLARGELIAHFDDDDLYAPAYLETMAARLEGADLVTLSAWFGYQEASGQFFWWDTTRLLAHRFAIDGTSVTPQARKPSEDPKHPQVDLNLWGYGFSYLFRRSAWEKAPFPAVNFGEDYQFARGIAAAGFGRTAVPDEQGLALHVIHGGNASRIFPQYRLPRFAVEKVFGPWLQQAMNGSVPP